MATVEGPKRADARRNRDRLIAAGREAFGEHGVQARLDDIARRAGVGPGTLYRHFPTREALLADVYRDEMEVRGKQAEELAAAYPPDEALAAFLRLQLDSIKNMRGLGAAVKAILASDAETMAYCRDTLYGALRPLLSNAQEAGLVRTDVQPPDVLRLVHGVAMACESAPEQAGKLLSVVLDGLRPPADTRQ